MSTLIENLQSIYTTKLQIKEVIGTQSDVFETYPELISAAIGTGGGIDWDEVAAYGYIVPAGTVTLSSNGTVDVSTYANAYVNVESGGITPTGYAYITTNGDYDVASYEMVNVNVSGGGSSSYISYVSMSSLNPDPALEWTDNGDGSFSYTFEYDTDNTDPYGYRTTTVTVDGNDYNMTIDNWSASDFLDGNNEIQATGTFTKNIVPSAGDYTESSVADINNYYSSWNLSVTATMDVLSPFTGVSFEWTFSGTPISQ